MFLSASLLISIPSLLTTFQDVFDLSIGQSSIIPIVLTLGALVANLLNAFFSAPLGQRTIFRAFFLVSVTSCLVVAFAQTLVVLYPGLFFLGFAGGLGIAATSTLYSHLPGKSQDFGLYHAAFGLGGILTPLIIGILFKKDIRFSCFFTGHSMVTFLSFVSIEIFATIPNKKYEIIRLKEALGIINKKYVYLPLLVITIYAGAENGIINWAGNLFTDEFRYSKDTSSSFLSIFWLVFTLVRFFTAKFEKMWGFIKTSIIFTWTGIISISLLLLLQAPLFFAFIDRKSVV